MEVKYVRIYQESTTTSVGELCMSQMIVSPNPVSNHALIRTPAEAEGSSVVVYDLQGRLLKSIVVQGEETSVDMSDWSPGIYLFKIRGANANPTFKVIKK